MRRSYKAALRVKGIRPIPKFEILRSHRGELEGEHVVIESNATRKEAA